MRNSLIRGCGRVQRLSVWMTRLATLLFVVTGLVGCGDDSAVVWKNAVTSPSGGKVVSTEVVQFGGLGTAAVITTVRISRQDGEGKPVDVLVLQNPSAANMDAIRVDTIWRDAKHLDITFPSDATLDFRADFYGGIEISSRSRQ